MEDATTVLIVEVLMRKMAHDLHFYPSHKMPESKRVWVYCGSEIRSELLHGKKEFSLEIRFILVDEVLIPVFRPIPI